MPLRRLALRHGLQLLVEILDVKSAEFCKTCRRVVEAGQFVPQGH